MFRTPGFIFRKKKVYSDMVYYVLHDEVTVKGLLL
jgi:hypothetical protein